MARPSGDRICPVCGEAGSGMYEKTVRRSSAKRYSYFYHPKGNSSGKKWCYVRLGLLRGMEKSRVELNKVKCFRGTDGHSYVELERLLEGEHSVLRCSYGTNSIMWLFFLKEEAVKLGDERFRHQVEQLFLQAGIVRDTLKYATPSTRLEPDFQ